MADVAYAAWRRPIKKDQPEGQPDEAVKLPKAYEALCLPFFATARTVMSIAKTPAKVQKIAKVYRS